MSGEPGKGVPKGRGAGRHGEVRGVSWEDGVSQGNHVGDRGLAVVGQTLAWGRTDELADVSVAGYECGWEMVDRVGDRYCNSHLVEADPPGRDPLRW